MLHLLEPLQYLWNALTAERSPRQIAWGIALGMWLGMIPKGNLTAGLVGVLLLATRVNLGSGMLTAMVVSALSSWVDPVTHAIGWRALHTEVVRSTLMAWQDIPLVPWLRFNNTVVLGSALLGFVAVLPAQYVAERIVRVSFRRIVRNAGSARHDSLGDHAQPTLELPAAVREALIQLTKARRESASPIPGQGTPQI